MNSLVNGGRKQGCRRLRTALGVALAAMLMAGCGGNGAGGGGAQTPAPATGTVTLAVTAAAPGALTNAAQANPADILAVSESWLWFTEGRRLLRRLAHDSDIQA